MAQRERVTIVGTGQMAVMCATLLCDNGHDVVMIGREQTIAQMRVSRTSPQLPNVELPNRVELSDDYRQTTNDLLILTVPTQALRQVAEEFVALPVSPFVSCSKGIEISTGCRPSQVAAQVVHTLGFACVLSGPNIAAEVVARKPAGAVVACEDRETACRVRDLFSTDYFRVYTSDDVVGVELAGATKNVIAIAAGIIDGLGLGNNAKASLVTRGLVEITRLGVALGAKAETFSGLAGMGDLITTCVSPEGRNRRVGEMIGQGLSVDDATAKLGSVCEGVPTTKAVLQLAAKHGVEMPIASAISGVLFEGKPVKSALLELMTREPKPE